MFMALDGVLSPAVIETRRALQLEAHLAAHCHDPAYQSLAMLAADRLPDRHEVLDLAHAVRSQEASDQNVGVREIQLLGRPALIGRRHAIAASAPSVEDRGEDARGVKARAAIPVDRSVSPDQGN